MLHPEDVERLSQLMSGELPPAEAETLQAELDRNPELQQAWNRLASLELLSSQIAAPVSAPLVERAVARAVRPRPRRWPLISAAVVAFAGAAWLAWPKSAGPSEEVLVVNRAAPAEVRSLEGTEVQREGEGVYRLVKGTALFEGTLTVRVNGESLEVRGKALITTEPSVALSHVTDLVTPTHEETEMFESAKAQWLTAVFAVLVFNGEVQAEEKISSGHSYSKQPVVAAAKAPGPTPGLAVLKAWPAPGKTPPAPMEVFDFHAVNGAVVAQGAALSKCYEDGLKQNPQLAGKLTPVLTIAAEGKLEEATLLGDYSLQNPFVASCVLAALQKVKFPAPKDVERAQLAYPLEFVSRGGNGSQLILPTEKDCPSCTYVNDRPGKVAVEAGSSPAIGPTDAKVTVVLFSEAECSFCVKAHGVLKQLETEYAGKVRFVFKHRPMPSHPGARQAAIALQAAQSQGKFWELLDLAYASPVETETGLYDSQARSLGLDLQKYRRDVESPATAAVVDADIAQAEKLGVKGVPSWFINGQEIVGFRPVEKMREAINAELKP